MTPRVLGLVLALGLVLLALEGAPHAGDPADAPADTTRDQLVPGGHDDGDDPNADALDRWNADDREDRLEQRDEERQERRLEKRLDEQFDAAPPEGGDPDAAPAE